MTIVDQTTPVVKPVSPDLYSLPTAEIMEWLYANVWVEISPGWRGLPETLIFDGADKPIILRRGDLCRCSYAEYVSLVYSHVLSSNPDIPFPYGSDRYPLVTLRLRSSRRDATPGSVYVIGNERGEYKIGRAKNAQRRLSHLQSGSVDTLTLEVVMESQDTLEAERRLHHAFAQKRISGEWFRLSEEDLQKIKEAV